MEEEEKKKDVVMKKTNVKSSSWLSIVICFSWYMLWYSYIKILHTTFHDINTQVFTNESYIEFWCSYYNNLFETAVVIATATIVADI